MKYVYCPLCAAPLVEEIRHNRARSLCPECGFIHFRDPKVAVIALVEWERRILLCGAPFEPERGKWALPGGYMDVGEMPEQALRRELHEEVRLDVQVSDLLSIFPMASAEGASRGIVLVYRARPTDEHRPTVKAHDDVSDARWFHAGELPSDLAFDSTISLLNTWQRNQTEIKKP